ncbi:MAG: sortase family protein [Berkelbacteria bacterium GW2011_GWA1_39_10]|uniref:Sortase family protein n=2 Tax=Candidatus Berkelbacteria TaxID=1618330 RepID=A0A0G0LID7_9BACT|nr:MAG: sortase family protein [Berkelbacteria bacterium GW2011_GWA1_39_10]
MSASSCRFDSDLGHQIILIGREMNNLIDEDDIKAIFTDKVISPQPAVQPLPIKRKINWPRFKDHPILNFVFLFILIFLVSFSIINFSAISKKIQYFLKVDIARKTFSVVPIPTSNPFDPISKARLVIPKINVDAPIVWNIPADQILDKLLEGVVHSKGTALPGSEGNIFITGHSSYYSWVDSPYKATFALLDKLEIGDEIYVQYQNKIFTYKINNVQVVSPKDVGVMDFRPGYNLTLMTCVPIGTTLNRLIINSEQILVSE